MRIYFVIYDRPLDFPDSYVVRPFKILYDPAGQPIFQPQTAHLAASLVEARQLIPDGLACFMRDQSDPKSIVETWI